MIFAFSPPTFPSTHSPGAQAMLSRLIGNLRGFAYRRRHDARWTMESISDGSRDITGYDPHRFIANGSLAFGDLILRADRPRVDERVRLAVLRRNRVAVEYRIRTAHGALVTVEDRFIPVFDSAGHVVAIEGIIDHARMDDAPTGPEAGEPASRRGFPASARNAVRSTPASARVSGSLTACLGGRSA